MRVFLSSIDHSHTSPFWRLISLLRLARIIGQCACLFAVAVLQITPAQWLQHHLTHHVFYEQRPDRKNYFERFADLNAGLG